MELLNRITINDDICNGKPTIRGFRVTVHTILEFLFAGTPEGEVLKQFPFLEKEDLDACKKFVLMSMDNKYFIKSFAA